MNRNDTLVVLDTCVLLKPRLSDVLMDLRAEGVFSAHWTENIDHEYLRNMEKVYRIPLSKAQKRLQAMKTRRPEWEVMMSSADFDAVPAKVDTKDRHVAAAALALRHAASHDTEDDNHQQEFDVILLTDNVKDLARKPMGMLGVRVLRAGEFLDEAYLATPAETTRAVMQAARELKKPPYSIAELLYILREEGAKTLVSRMSKALGIKPVVKNEGDRI